jgi:N utilization substance protein B
MPGGRRKAREVVFRAVFETEITGDDLVEILEYALGRYRLTEDGRDHAIRLARHLRSRRTELRERIAARLQHWEFGRLSAVVRAILLVAVAELEGTEVPVEVVLDEAVELAHRYGEEDSAKFVNGVLDPIAAGLRPGEERGRPERRGVRWPDRSGEEDPS